MPLKSGSSREVVFENIAAERNAGKPAAQAEAIAFSKARGDSKWGSRLDAACAVVEGLSKRVDAASAKADATNVFAATGKFGGLSSRYASEGSHALAKRAKEIGDMYHKAGDAGTAFRQTKDSKFLKDFEELRAKADRLANAFPQ